MSTVLSSPSLAQAERVLADALAGDDRGVVTVVGECSVEYEGRAASSLAPGVRLLVVKPDGTTLVHAREQHDPVNWQPPGSELELVLDSGLLRVTATRSSPAEQLDVWFSSVSHVTISPVDTHTESEDAFEVVGTEEDLRERLLQRPAEVEAGFTPMAIERETTAGPVDIYGKDGEGRPTVVELKRRRVGPDAVGQLERYVGALDRELASTRTVRGILVAPSITARAAELIEQNDALTHVSVAPQVED